MDSSPPFRHDGDDLVNVFRLVRRVALPLIGDQQRSLDGLRAHAAPPQAAGEVRQGRMSLALEDYVWDGPRLELTPTFVQIGCPSLDIVLMISGGEYAA